jgi:hypothetical protein
LDPRLHSITCQTCAVGTWRHQRSEHRRSAPFPHIEFADHRESVRNRASLRPSDASVALPPRARTSHVVPRVRAIHAGDAHRPQRAEQRDVTTADVCSRKRRTHPTSAVSRTLGDDPPAQSHHLRYCTCRGTLALRTTTCRTTRRALVSARACDAVCRVCAQLPDDSTTRSINVHSLTMIM